MGSITGSAHIQGPNSILPAARAKRCKAHAAEAATNTPHQKPVDINIDSSYGDHSTKDPLVFLSATVACGRVFWARLLPLAMDASKQDSPPEVPTAPASPPGLSTIHLPQHAGGL